ncbi:hypothetical protein [Alkalibacillus haloalkaliphilus]|uniref:hypothetical protein n=1 Tax=Alkalibacillus haloalkaliphilus TaxID=94136 RepID=UPI00293699A8|nr:hypothetical protein [Alkalibacillus haloalkaliphilus]MDV2581557.1 hypothetical protein [Alkalibacillus haloalkaliphilus]
MIFQALNRYVSIEKERENAGQPLLNDYYPYEILAKAIGEIYELNWMLYRNDQHFK